MIIMNNKTWLVSIILLNYNWKKFNKNCIDSILLQSYTNFEIIFVDNNSTDWSLEEIENIYIKEINSWKIKIVKNSENLRFAWWNNSWVRESSQDSEYIWLLNNDTIIEKDCLLELIKWIESDKTLWAVWSLIFDEQSKSRIEEKTENWKVLVMNVFWLQVWWDGDIKNYVYYTNFLCWCSILYKKSIVEQPFFDFYKIYAEDMQLSWEIILKWYKLWTCRNSKVLHFWSATMNKMPYTKIYLNTRNLLINYHSFLSKKTRLKLFIPFFVLNVLQLFSNFSLFFKLLRAKWNSFFWVLKNKKTVNRVKERISSWKIISEKDFLSTMSYKLAEDDFYSERFKSFLIKILNYLNKVYYIVFFIPFKK